MLNEQEIQDADRLIEIAEKQGYKINLSTVLISIKYDETKISEMLTYIEEKGVEIITEDVEPDFDEPSELDSKVTPFDPSKIDIKMAVINVDSIIKRINNEELELDSAFQRKAGLWNTRQKSQLIESIFLKIPLPAFYFDATNDDKWQVIDGLQRITTIKDYVIEQNFALSGMEFLRDLEGLKYHDVPRSLQRRLEETQLNTYQVNPSTPKNVKFNIFKRINTGGLTLEAQEIRNALYQGKSTDFLKKLALCSEFKEATGYSIKSDRMLDREFCIRYVAFTEIGLEEYNGGLDDYLNNAMDFLNKSEDFVLDRIEQGFKKTMNDCYNNFGDYAFRRVNTETGRRGPVNKALFETWSATIHSLRDDEVKILKEKKDELIEQFFKLSDDYSFQNAIKASDKTSVNYHFSAIQKIVNKILGKTK